ncbi:glycosyltransferase family 4 protein [Roseobacter ponti]|uniref:Glycosyltransferase family 4 protein n=1 Tax=Roseobacter ponti TaxID=1891787 RepID=A0A858SN95_9RHOB|nr:glycosyltransferase family 4 protein [Roseobacter ponti]QJF50284.1 glycosyltransferase family 4 protein [Roseobacter ponti]
MLDESSRSFRIAMVAACPFPLDRGTPIRIERMARSLTGRGHKVDVFTYHYGGDRPDDGLNIIRIRGSKRYARTAPGPSPTKLALLDPQLAWRLYNATAGVRYDMIHAHHVEGLLVSQMAARRRGLPLVFDVHALLGSELPFYRTSLPSTLVRRVGRVFDRILPGMADHLITVSGEIEQAILQQGKLSQADITCIPNGVERELFASNEITPADQPTIVFAGNFAPYQGIENLLEAFALVRTRVPDVRLVMLSGSDFAPYRAQADALNISDAIEFRSVALSDLGDSLAKCAIAVNPRIDCAGLPQKLLNYMAAGCAIVSFEGSAKHIKNEESALIVPDGSIDAMARCIERLIRDSGLRRKLGQRAQEIARTELSWEQAAARIEAVYTKLLAAR